jgi:hypothetical protein
MAKYILKNTSLFIGINYYPEGSILNISEREAERISKSISAGYLEIIPEEERETNEIGNPIAENQDIEYPELDNLAAEKYENHAIDNHELDNLELDNSEIEIPVRAQRSKRKPVKKENPQ